MNREHSAFGKKEKNRTRTQDKGKVLALLILSKPIRYALARYARTSDLHALDNGKGL